MKRRSRHVAGLAAAGAALAAVTAAGLAERTTVQASFTVLAYLHWLWIPAAVGLESASMAAFAIMLRRLLAVGGARVGVRPMLATTYAANAVSVSVPLAGPALATAFTFRRFTRQGADAPLAGWSLLVGGLTSCAAAVLVVVGGGLASGNVLVTAVTVVGGVLALAVLAGAVAAVRRPRLRGALERPAGWTLRQGSRILRRPVADPGQTIRAWAQRLGSLQLSPSGWLTATALALANWLADAAVLAVSIRATGAAIPWHDLLLVYGSGIAAQGLNITPGGLGVTEGTLSLALAATGLGASRALAAVLLYRLASFWLVALAGWLVVFWLRRPRARRGPGPSRRTPHEQDADLGSTGTPAGLGAHELVLLHGQPGSPADWQLVCGRLPAPLHAVAADRPGYGSSRLPAAGFAANARAVLDDLDSRGITRAVLVGHSYGGGVALSAASLAPGRVAAVVLLASVGPGCVTGWDRLLAAPGAGQLCALVAWRLTPWIARARLARIARRRGRPLRPDEHVNWQVWGYAGDGRLPLWSTFLTEQRALLRELDELEDALASVRVPVLVLADPQDTVVPFETARRLARALPDARLQLVEGAGHHLPRRAPAVVADAIAAFLAAAEITDVPDRPASRDVNSPQVLSVLAGRGRSTDSSAMRPEEGKIKVANTRHDRAGGNSARPRRGPRPEMRARERIAAERAARKRAEARRRILVAVASVTAVLAVVVALAAVKLTSTPARLVASESPASSVVVRQVTTVPAAVLTRVSPGQEITPLREVKTSGPPLRIGGKPAIVFVSEESCPFCAAERWSLAVALSHFGIWSHLGTTTSSATDVYPDTATLSFRTAHYQSTELTLRTTELTDNAGRPLQAQTPLDTSLIGTFDVPPYVNSADQSGAVPFLDIANRYVLAGAQYDPQVLAGLSAAQIASQLSNPASPVAAAIDGSAQVIVAAINQVLYGQAGPPATAGSGG
jgi:pimeloyl-ACP methyl ester carboxylesterase